MIIYKPLTKKLLLDFFGVQNNLQVVRLAVAECPEEFRKELLFHVLENCPKLLEFSYRFGNCPNKLFEPYHLNLTLAELPRFFTSISKLECLTLSFNSEETPSFESLPLLALTALRLERTKRMNEDFCIGFLKQCPRLKHLELAKLSDIVLQRIFEYCVSSQYCINMYSLRSRRSLIYSFYFSAEFRNSNFELYRCLH